MREDVKEFYKKGFKNNKFVKKKKKVSFGVNEEFLQVIDELASLSKNSRSVIIESLIVWGMFPYFKFLESSWKRFLDDGNYKKLEEVIGDLLKGLKKIKSKHRWLNSDYHWEALLSKGNLDEETKKGMIRLFKAMDLMSPDKNRFQKILK